VPAVEECASEQHVSVGDCEEGQQRMRAVHRLPEYLFHLRRRTARRPTQQEATKQSRYGGTESETDHGRVERRVDEQRATAQCEPSDADRGVDAGQLGPALTALEYAELRAHQRQTAERGREQQDRDHGVDVQ
jgi:hypothetical protein